MSTIYFVDSKNGAANNDGLSRDSALATVPQAVALAATGDVINVVAGDADALAAMPMSASISHIEDVGNGVERIHLTDAGKRGLTVQEHCSFRRATPAELLQWYWELAVSRRLRPTWWQRWRRWLRGWLNERFHRTH